MSTTEVRSKGNAQKEGRGSFEAVRSWDPPPLPLSFQEDLRRLFPGIIPRWNAFDGCWEFYGRRPFSHRLYPQAIVTCKSPDGAYRPPGQDVINGLQKAQQEYARKGWRYYQEQADALYMKNEKKRQDGMEKFSHEYTDRVLRELNFTWRTFGRTKVSVPSMS